MKAETKKNIKLVLGIVGLLGIGNTWSVLSYIPSKIAESRIEQSIERDNKLLEKADSNVTAKIIEFAAQSPHIANLSKVVKDQFPTTEESVKWLKETIDFANKAKDEDSLYTINHRWVTSKREWEKKYRKAGYIVSDIITGEPLYFMASNGKEKEIFYGKPRESLLEDVWYYYDDKGKLVILTYLRASINQ